MQLIFKKSRLNSNNHLLKEFEIILQKHNAVFCIQHLGKIDEFCKSLHNYNYKVKLIKDSIGSLLLSKAAVNEVYIKNIFSSYTYICFQERNAQDSSMLPLNTNIINLLKNTNIIVSCILMENRVVAFSYYNWLHDNYYILQIPVILGKSLIQYQTLLLFYYIHNKLNF
jgi:hypothetical protein